MRPNILLSVPEFSIDGGYFFSERPMDHPDSLKLIEEEIYRIHLANVKMVKEKNKIKDTITEPA